MKEETDYIWNRCMLHWRSSPLQCVVVVCSFKDACALSSWDDLLTSKWENRHNYCTKWANVGRLAGKWKWVIIELVHVHVCMAETVSPCRQDFLPSWAAVIITAKSSTTRERSYLTPVISTYPSPPSLTKSVVLNFTICHQSYYSTSTATCTVHVYTSRKNEWPVSVQVRE